MQTFLVWQLILSRLILKRHYRFNQVVGCILVSVGVVITVMRYFSLQHYIMYNLFFVYIVKLKI